MANKNFLIKNGLTVGGAEIVNSSGALTQSLITAVPSGAAASTQSVGNSSTAIATTAYVRGEIDALIDSAPGTLNTLNELAAAINDDAAFNTTLTNAVALKAPLASPTFTGTPSINHGSTPYLDLKVNSTMKGRFYADANQAIIEAVGNSLILKSASTTALTFDSSQAATFASSVSAPQGFINGSNGGLRIHSGGTKFFNITAGNSARDGIMDIGASDARFKDLYLSSQVLAGAGSVSAPSLSFAGDPNTGIYSGAADNMYFAIGGALKGFWSATQFNVTGNGIFSGNGTFGGTLGVTGVVTANAGINVDALNIDGRTIASTDTNGNINILPNGTGKVGIGTASPRTLLNLSKSAQSQTQIGNCRQFSLTDSAGYNATRVEMGMGYWHPTHTYQPVVLGAIITDDAGQPVSDFYIATKTSTDGDDAPIERFRIAKDGKVGIGTSTAAYSTSLLTVRNNANSSIQGMSIILEPTSNTSDIDGALTIEMSDANITGGTAMRINTAGSQSDIYAIRTRYNGTSNEGFAVKGDGKVGIGTTSPGSKLHLKDTATNSIVQTTWENDARKWSFGVHGGLSDAINLYDHTASASRFTVLADGKVGIGTTGPVNFVDIIRQDGGDAALGIKSSSAGDPTIHFDSALANRSAVISFKDQGTQSGFIRYHHNGNRMQFGSESSSTVSMTIKGEKVGIGTPDPSQRLHVFQTEGSVGAKHAAIQFGGYAAHKDRGPMIAAYRATGNSNDQGLIFSTYDATNASNDRYKIGHTGKHEFNGAHQGDSVGHFIFSNQNTTDGTSTNCTLMVKNGNAQVQIMPWSTLGARIGTRGGGWSSNSNNTVHLTANDVANFILTAGGTPTFGNGNSISSDERLKKNITNIADGQLAKINALTPRTFEWKDSRKTGHKEGFIAQEVATIIPEGVSEVIFSPDPDDTSRDFEGPIKVINQEVMNARLIKAVQELSAELDAAKARITTLEG